MISLLISVISGWTVTDDQRQIKMIYRNIQRIIEDNEETDRRPDQFI